MQPILEVAIGMVVAVATLAVVVSSAMELVSAFLRLRARSLEQGLARMLDGQSLSLKAAKAQWKDPSLRSPATAALLGHPLVRALSSPNGDDGKPPSYIDAITFGTALFGSSLGADELVGATVGSAESGFADRLPDLPGGVATPMRQDGTVDWPACYALLMKAPDARTMLAELVGDESALRKRIDDLAKAGDLRAAPLSNALAANTASGRLSIPGYLDSLMRPLSEIGDSVEKIEMALQRITAVNPHLGGSLQSLWLRADRTFVDFREYVEDWFDREMARVSGWYSRRAQWILLGFGIALAFALNLSLVTVAKRVWEDPTLRAAGVELAEQALATPTTATTMPTTETSIPPTTDTTTEDGVSDAPQTTTSEAPPTTTSEGGGAPTTVPPAEATATGVQDLVSKGFPIGWNESAWPGFTWYLALHLLGIVMAGIAASFGAPFWFDLLNRLVNLRAAGKPPPIAAEKRTTAPPP